MSDASQPTQERVEFSITAATISPGEMIPFSEPVAVPEVLVDGLANTQAANGILRLTFFVERSDVERGGKQSRPVVARLAMTPVAAAGLAATLSAVLQALVEQNVIPSLPEVVQK